MPELPLDVLIHILACLPPLPSSDTSVAVFRAFLESSSLLREAASVSSLWAPHYRARYRHCNEGREEERLERAQGDWRSLYFERRRLDRLALTILDKIIGQRTDKAKHIRSLYDMGFDVIDVLTIECEQPTPKRIRDIAVWSSAGAREDEQVITPFAVTRKYWARSVTGAIHRRYALGLWDNLKRDEGDVSFETSFSALSSFLGHSHLMVDGLLADLKQRCPIYLKDTNCVFDPHEPSYDLRTLCKAICSFMKAEGFGPAAHGNFHVMENIFPHTYLTTNKESIPISLIHIFVALARDIGIQASPIDLPGRVIAHIRSPREEEEDFYVDVFGADHKAILELHGDIIQRILQTGVSPQELDTYILPAPAQGMLIRTSRNIITTYHNDPTTEHRAMGPLYAAFSIFLLFASREHFVRQLVGHMGLTDTFTLIPDFWEPRYPIGHPIHTGFNMKYREAVNTLKASSAPCLRSAPENQHVRYPVGLVFRHKNLKYIGCIVGWDNHCKMDDNWQQSMHIEQLSGGSNQPFYTCLAMDGTERYVAQENVNQVKPAAEHLVDFFDAIPSMPVYFSDIVEDDDTMPRLQYSPAMTDAFPEDAEVLRQSIRAWNACTPL